MAWNELVRVGKTAVHLDANTWNKIIRAELGRKAQSITNNPDLRREIAERMLGSITKYVPMKTGKLRGSGQVTADGRLIWYAIHNGIDYATIQYETQYAHYTTSGTGPYWDEVFVEKDWEDFKQRDDIIALIKKAYKES